MAHYKTISSNFVHKLPIASLLLASPFYVFYSRITYDIYDLGNFSIYTLIYVIISLLYVFLLFSSFQSFRKCVDYVAISDKYLLIRNKQFEQEVLLEKIRDVKKDFYEPVILKATKLTLFFDTKTRFGTEIDFVPKQDLFLTGARKVLMQLQEIVDRNKKQ
ncbi:MAG: hypothetical protein R3E13_02585 [Alphaproteobacteria bacterium]